MKLKIIISLILLTMLLTSCDEVINGNGKHKEVMFPDWGKAFVANYNHTSGNTVSVVCGRFEGIIRTLYMGQTGITTYSVAANSRSRKVYIGNYTAGTVSVIHGDELSIIATVHGISNPGCIAVNEETNTIYVGDDVNNCVYVIDGERNYLKRTIDITGSPSDATYQGGPVSICVNPSTNTLHIANEYYTSGTTIDETSYTILNLDTGFSTTHIGIAGDNHAKLAVNPVSNKVYLSVADTDTVYVFPSASSIAYHQLAGTFQSPSYITVDTENNYVYISNRSGGYVTVIDGRTDMKKTEITGMGDVYMLAFHKLTKKIVASSPNNNTIYFIDGEKFTILGSVMNFLQPIQVAFLY